MLHDRTVADDKVGPFFGIVRYQLNFSIRGSHDLQWFHIFDVSKCQMVLRNWNMFVLSCGQSSSDIYLDVPHANACLLVRCLAAHVHDSCEVRRGFVRHIRHP